MYEINTLFNGLKKCKKTESKFVQLTDKKCKFCWFCEMSCRKWFVAVSAKLLTAKRVDNYISLVVIACVRMKAILN